MVEFFLKKRGQILFTKSLNDIPEDLYSQVSRLHCHELTNIPYD